MPAPQEISVTLETSTSTDTISKLGIIAGSGALPRLLLKYCDEQGIEPYVVGFVDQTDAQTLEGRAHLLTRIGSSGKTIKWLRSNGVEHLVLIGAVKRPRLFDSIPDFVTLKFFLRVGLRSIGDSDVLNIARDLLEKEGFRLHGVHDFINDILMPAGVIGAVIPDKQSFEWIDVGFQASQNLGIQDIGQSVIVLNNEVVGREDARGTSILIEEHGQEGAVLVKSCKPQQDKDLDLPTIGLETIDLCVAKKMRGIAGHAKNSLLIDSEEVKQIADKHGLFIYGVKS